MAEQANIRSLEALETLRAALIIYQAKAKRALDMALEESKAAERWVREEQRRHWEQEIRKRDRVLERAKAELMTVKMSALADHIVLHQEAVTRAERSLAQAREKMLLVRKWSRDIDTVLSPPVRRLESVREHFQHDLPKAITWLHQAQVTLADYQSSGAPLSTSPASAAAPAAENRERPPVSSGDSPPGA